MANASPPSDSMPMAGETILVTGACGFVGANVCLHFAGRAATVWAVTGPSGSDWRLRGAHDVERVKLDLCVREEVHSFIAAQKPSVVINCAAYGAYSNQTDADRIYAVNFSAVRSLLEAVRRLSRFTAFIQAGSSSEYGLNCAGPSEDGPTRPESHYAVSKVAASALTQFYGAKLDVPAWVGRLYSVYGPYEDVSRLIPQLLLCAEGGTYPPLVDRRVSRDFVFVADVCAAIEQIVRRAPELRRGEIYNIGSGVRSTLGDLVELVRTTFRVPREPVWGSMANRSWDHADWFANPRKAKEELLWSATTPLRAGLLATMRWLYENPELVVEAEQRSVTRSSS